MSKIELSKDQKIFFENLTNLELVYRIKLDPQAKKVYRMILKDYTPELSEAVSLIFSNSVFMPTPAELREKCLWVRSQNGKAQRKDESQRENDRRFEALNAPKAMTDAERAKGRAYLKAIGFYEREAK